MAKEKFSRAQRRHERGRLIKQRAERFAWLPSLTQCISARERAVVSRAARTPRPCSCWMCGNPRRYFGALTLAERRANQLDES